MSQPIVTSQDWHASVDPEELLDSLGPLLIPDALTGMSPKKVRTFSVGDRKLQMLLIAWARLELYRWRDVSDSETFLKEALKVLAWGELHGREWTLYGSKQPPGFSKRHDTVSHLVLSAAMVEYPFGSTLYLETLDRIRNLYTTGRRFEQAHLVRDLLGDPFLNGYKRCDTWLENGIGKCRTHKTLLEKSHPRAVCPGEFRYQWHQHWGEIINLAQVAFLERSSVCICRGGLTDHGGLTGIRCHLCGGTGSAEYGFLDPARLSILADALEEFGSTNELVLSHLRGWYPCSGCLDSGWAGYVRRHDRHGQCFHRCEKCNPEDELSRLEIRPGWVCGPHLHAAGCWAHALVLGSDLPPGIPRY